MGLDQYLLAKVSNKEKLAQLKTEATGACGGLFPLTIKTNGKAELGYWRKWYQFDNYMWDLLKNTLCYQKCLSKEIAYYINKYSDPEKIEGTWYATKDEIIAGIQQAGGVESYATKLVLTYYSRPNCEPIRVSKKLVEKIISDAKGMISYYKTEEGIADAYEECRNEWGANATDSDLREYLDGTIKEWEGIVKTFLTALELINDYNATIYYEVWY